MLESCLPDAAVRASRYVYERPVRFADVDSFGHVNNVRFLDFLEDARVAMFYRDAGRRMDMVVVRHEIDYRRPLKFRLDPVRVELWVTEIGPVRFTLAGEIRDDEELYVEARTVLVAYDVAKARPRRLEEGELAYLRRFLATS